MTFTAQEEKWHNSLRSSSVEISDRDKELATRRCVRRIEDPVALAEVLGALGLASD